MRSNSSTTAPSTTHAPTTVIGRPNQAAAEDEPLGLAAVAFGDFLPGECGSVALKDHAIRAKLPLSSMYGSADSPSNSTGANGVPADTSGGTG